jgi:hypothetical protein
MTHGWQVEISRIGTDLDIGMSWVELLQPKQASEKKTWPNLPKA